MAKQLKYLFKQIVKLYVRIGYVVKLIRMDKFYMIKDELDLSELNTSASIEKFVEI